MVVMIEYVPIEMIFYRNERSFFKEVQALDGTVYSWFNLWASLSDSPL